MASMYPPHKEPLLAQKPYRSLPSTKTPDALAPTLTDITTMTTAIAVQRRQRSGNDAMMMIPPIKTGVDDRGELSMH